MRLGALLVTALCGAALLAVGAWAEEDVAAEPTLAALIAATPELGYFAAMLERAALEEMLEQDGPFTVFAPVDDAFLFMDAAAFDALLEDPERLRAVLFAHLVDGRYDSDALLTQGAVITLDGETIRVEPGDQGPILNEAVVLAEASASNGVLYLIPMLLGEADAAPPS